jgi:hypothetical protein
MIAIVFALTIPAAGALADDVGGDVIQIQPQAAVIVAEEPVTAPPPAYVELESRAVAAGIGARVGNGVLLVNGQEHGFKVSGVSLGDFGISSIVGEGPVANLDDIEDFAGHYVAVEAGAAIGKGASAMTMRNEHGVVITLDSRLTGAQLTLGAQGLDIELQ